MAIVLDQLDQKRIAVEITIAGEVRLLLGVGDFVHDDILGDCLRIIPDDSQAEVEILLRKSEWSGPIVVDDLHGCDYLLRLDPACLLK
jgi:hypothetical protein